MPEVNFGQWQIRRQIHGVFKMLPRVFQIFAARTVSEQETRMKIVVISGPRRGSVLVNAIHLAAFDPFDDMSRDSAGQLAQVAFLRVGGSLELKRR